MNDSAPDPCGSAWTIGGADASVLAGCDLSVFVADTGSIRGGKKNFGWAKAGEEPDADDANREISRFIHALETDLGPGASEPLVSAGFEFPLFLPIASDVADVGAARSIDLNRAWTAAGGAMALPTGLAQLGYVFGRLAERVGSGLVVCTSPRTAVDEGTLLVWEAFVSGPSRSECDHHRDCAESRPSRHHTCDAWTCAEFSSSAFGDGAVEELPAPEGGSSPSGWVNLVEAAAQAIDGVSFRGPRRQGLVVRHGKAHNPG